METIVATKKRITDPFNTKTPEKIEVKISFSAGLLWSIIWLNCPHKDDVIESWIQSKKTALTRVERYGWTLIEHPQKTSAQFVATKEQFHRITCDFCGKNNYPDHNYPNLFWGFRDGDTKMFVGHDCKEKYYEVKNAGKFGKEHAGKYSEIPEPVPTAPKEVTIKYTPGSDWSIIWANCPNHDNILKSHIKTSFLANDIVKENGWKLITEKAKKSRKPEKKFITGLHGCSCHPFSSWEECKRFHNQTFNIGDTVKNRHNNKEGQVLQKNDVKGYLTVAYGKKPSDNHLEHVASLILLKEVVVEPIQKKAKNSNSKKGGQRTEMLKLRCSKEFKELVQEMATLTNCSAADIIHKAVKYYPKSSVQLHTKIDQERLDEII